MRSPYDHLWIMILWKRTRAKQDPWTGASELLTRVNALWGRGLSFHTLTNVTHPLQGQNNRLMTMWYMFDMQRGPNRWEKTHYVQEMCKWGNKYERIEDFRNMLISPVKCGPTYISEKSNISHIRGTEPSSCIWCNLILSINMWIR
jgi:hypothetical protein